MTDGEKREAYMSYMRGFCDGAGVLAMKPAFTQSTKEHIRNHYGLGYSDGVATRRQATERVCALIGYEPTILRVQKAEAGAELDEARR